jgi:hypothetical protein
MMSNTNTCHKYSKKWFDIPQHKIYDDLTNLWKSKNGKLYEYIQFMDYF